MLLFVRLSRRLRLIRMTGGPRHLYWIVGLSLILDVMLVSSVYFQR